MFDAFLFNTDSIMNELLMTFSNAPLYSKKFRLTLSLPGLYSCKNYKSFHFQLDYLLKQAAQYDHELFSILAFIGLFLHVILTGLRVRTSWLLTRGSILRVLGFVYHLIDCKRLFLKMHPARTRYGNHNSKHKALYGFR